MDASVGTDPSASKIIKNLPTHIAIIMDGNGRWAAARGLPRLAGHREGTENIRRVIRACDEFKVKYLTIYAFSTENWGRPSDEVEGLMMIMADVIDRELNNLHEQNVRLVHIGNLEKLKPNLIKKIKHAVELTSHNTGLVLCIAWNYGGRDEIITAVQKMISAGITPEEVTESLMNSYLYTAGIPDPDLIIRTSGEMRLSNFLIWQAAYAEWYITETLWPDFGREELLGALENYSQRNRRYGKLSSPCSED